MAPRIGVLAYGSLISEPGEELAALATERRGGIRTPFRVEFARKSSGRDGAPTLVPVDRGGAHVEATILVLGDGVSLEAARDMVYRRETGRVGNQDVRYRPDSSKPNQVYVEVLPNFAGLDWVLFTRIAANISDPTPKALAELAVASAKEAAGASRRDGISYLHEAIANGIRTPLSDAYRREVLSLTDAVALEDAWDKVSTPAPEPERNS